MQQETQQGQVQTIQQQAISFDVYQLVNAYRLGTLIKEYKNNTGSKMVLGIVYIISGIICILIGLLLLLVVISSGLISLLFAAIPLVLTGLAFFLNYGRSLVRRARRNRGAGVYLCTDGLLCTKESGVDAIRWDQIAEIWQTFTEISYYGRKYYMLRQFLLRRPDGTVLVLDAVFRSFKEIGAAVEQQVVSRFLPGVLAAYHAGNTVSFGPISVHLQGMNVSVNNGQKMLTWDELDRVKIAEGIISIKKKGSLLAMTTVPMAQVPNVCLFAALVNAVTNGQKLQLTH
ncbi:MAG TPA: DUF6585 family protein [Ktedonobacteraceae bacterium]|nr:DUF6585 family protein [Ktedonobacteraceae bacterium]